MSDWGAEQTRVQELLGENERLAEAYRDANELSEADLRRAGQAEAEVERLRDIARRTKALLTRPDVKLQGRNFVEFEADRLFRDIDAALTDPPESGTE